MTEKSAEAPRTPEERAEHVLWEVRNDPDVDAHPEATARECIIRGIRAAPEARDAELRAVDDIATQMRDRLATYKGANWYAKVLDYTWAMNHRLRALLSEGKPGK